MERKLIIEMENATLGTEMCENVDTLKKNDINNYHHHLHHHIIASSVKY